MPLLVLLDLALVVFVVVANVAKAAVFHWVGQMHCLAGADQWLSVVGKFNLVSCFFNRRMF